MNNSKQKTSNLKVVIELIFRSILGLIAYIQNWLG
ncbi:hypothetical protein MACA111363_10135 [Macrococcoides canis]|uniref:Uncharacterized protein n=1 Tax=Macrococcoides canis TaxID=1855823 RepID=A0A1W7A7Z5_9STAP|nr:hypothetical protein MCCS_00800 [Macrococcus canis]AXE74992.1 hypothetical protein [Macrococcus canis]